MLNLFDCCVAYLFILLTDFLKFIFVNGAIDLKIQSCVGIRLLSQQIRKDFISNFKYAECTKKYVPKLLLVANERLRNFLRSVNVFELLEVLKSVPILQQ